ncbi:unnamed protein product [Closterium sp. NIES-54]
MNYERFGYNGGDSGGGRGGAVQRGGSGGGQRQQQQRRSETPTPQQLREWFALRGASGGSVRSPYDIRTGDRAGQTCGKFHSQHRCFSRLDEAWRAEFGDEAECPRWSELLRSGVDIFALDYDAILAAMYALSVSAEGNCYLCVPPDPGIEAATLGASESSLPGTVPAEALHNFRDSTTLTPRPAPVPVRLADPSGGPVLARSSTVLPCLTVPSGSLPGLHLPSFSTNLVSTAALQDAMVTTTTPGGQRVSICTCTRTGRHLATFTRRPGSSLYTLATEPSQVVASAQVSASGQVAASCSCRLLSHQTLLWHHRLGHPSLPRLRGMHSRLLVSGLPMSLPPLPPSPAPPCLPCVKGRQRAAPHSSSFPPMTPPLQTLHMDSVSSSASDSARTFLSCVCTLTEVVSSPPTSCGTFVVGRAFSSPQPLAPCLLAGDLATLRWTGKVGDASVFRVWGSRAFVRDTSTYKLSTRAIPCVFLGFVPDAPGWQFYHPTSRHALLSQDVTFDESVPFTVSSPTALPLSLPRRSSLLQVPLHVDSGAARGSASGGAEPGGAEPVGAEPRGSETGGAERGGAEP